MRATIRQTGGLKLREVAGALYDVLEAVQFLHDRGLLHRDIKPGDTIECHVRRGFKRACKHQLSPELWTAHTENLFWTQQQRVRIADFGLTRLISGTMTPQMVR
jgi:serine/threonine protein kinase